MCIARKRHTGEYVPELPREIELKLAGGGDVASAWRSVRVSDARYDNWRKRLGGMGRSQLSAMKSLEKENARLKKIAAEFELNKLNHKDSSIARLRPTHPNHVWAIDFVHDTSEYIRPDIGPEFAAEAMQDWLRRVDIKPIRIYSGSPWENGYNERFNGTLRRQLLNTERFTTAGQVQIVINHWFNKCNYTRPTPGDQHASACPGNHVGERLNPWPRNRGR